MVIDADLYEQAQIGLAQLKSAVLTFLTQYGGNGLKQTDIGRPLGIHSTPDGKQEGWIAAFLLRQLAKEGVVEQKDNLWFIPS